MRFLDRNWLESEDPMKWLNVQVYVRHLEDIADDLPNGARALGALSVGTQLMGTEIVVHSFDDDVASFNLVLKVQTLSGESYLDIRYHDVEVDSLEVNAFDDAKALLTDEFDLAPNGYFEHRLLLEPEGEALIRFKDMTFRVRKTDGDE